MYMLLSVCLAWAQWNCFISNNFRESRSFQLDLVGRGDNPISFNMPLIADGPLSFKAESRRKVLFFNRPAFGRGVWKQFTYSSFGRNEIQTFHGPELHIECKRYLN